MNYQIDICETIVGEPNAPTGIRKKYERIGHGIMKKIRVLILLLVVLLLPCLMFIACGDDENATNCDEGHTWRFEDRPHKQKLIASGTCTTPEIRERECKVCGFTEQYESKKPTGHRYDSTKKIYLNDATCETNGHYVLHCYKYDICGHTADKYEEVPGTAIGHTFLHYIPTKDDPTIGEAKCVDCDKTETKFLSIKADMEGDRSHLSYDAIMVNTAKVESAKDYTGYKTVGDNTYLAVTRPAPGTYLGGTNFGVTISPNVYALENTTYIFEAVLFLKQSSCDVQIVGKKSQLGQTMPFITYNKANGTIDGIAGAVYGLTEDDYENGVKIALLINDKDQWYQIYVNDALVRKSMTDDSEKADIVKGTITYGDDYNYYAGFALGGFEIIALGDAETEFGVDDIKVYAGTAPEGYDKDNVLNQSYTTVTLSTGEQVSIKLPAKGCEHNFVGGTPVSHGCVTAGYTVFTCTECGGQEIRDEDEPVGHTFDIHTSYEADCFNPGYDVKECSVCHAKEAEQTAPKLEHKHGDDAEYTEPTCEDNAITKGDCIHCGTYFEFVDKGTAYGHELGEGAVVTNPTCTTDGYTSGLCKRCGEEYTDENSIVKAFGHYSLTYTTHSATCDTAGCKVYTCASCGVEQIEEIAAEPIIGHKLFTKIGEKDGKKWVTNSCVNCEYSFSFVPLDNPFPSFGAMKGNLGDKLFNWAYAVDDPNAKVMGQGGDYNTVIANTGWKNVQWDNLDNHTARMLMASSGSDGHNDFAGRAANNRYGLKGESIIFETDVRHPTEGELSDLGEGFVPGGTILGFRNAGTVVRVAPDGKVYVRKTSDTGYGVTGETVATISADKWTKIAIKIDFTYCNYTVYINGEKKAVVDMPEAEATKQDGKNGGTEGMRIGVQGARNGSGVGVIYYRNIYVYEGVTPVNTVVEKAPTDKFGTTFKNDTDINKFDKNGYLIDFKGDLKIKNKVNFNATIKNDKLVINAGPNTNSVEDADTGAFDSYIEGPLSAFDGMAYTVKLNVKFDKTTGEYDLIKLVRSNATVSESLVYIKDRKLNALGGYTYTLGEGEELEIVAIIRDGVAGNNYDLYINGIARVKGESFADGDYANTLGAGTSMMRMFYIRNNSYDMSVTVSDIDVYDKDVSLIKEYAFDVEGNKTEQSNFVILEETVNVEYLVALGNGIKIEDKANFRASISGSALNLVYDKDNVKTHFGADDKAFDSALALSLAEYKDLTFAAKLKFTPNATTGAYDVFAIDRDDKKQSLVYVEGGTLKVFNSGYELSLEPEADAGDDTTEVQTEEADSLKAIELEIVINDGSKGDTFTLYVNGKIAAANVSFNDTEVGNLGSESVLRMFRVTNADAVMDVTLNSFEIYTILEEADYYGTAFPVSKETNVFFDGTTNIVKDLCGDLNIVTKQNFTAKLDVSKLYLNYVPGSTSVDGAEEGFDSHIFADISKFNGTYTVNIEAILSNITGKDGGKYDVFKLVGADKSLDVITVDGNTITTYGGWKRTFNFNDTVIFDIVVNGGKLSVYVDGILIVDSVAIEGEYTSFKMFNVVDAEKSMKVDVVDINVYDKEVIPQHYVGKLANLTEPGRIDNALSFDGTDNPLDFVPANSKVAGGFYYEEISGSYLLAVAPADIKPMANTNLVKISAKDGKADENGVWTLNVGDFATNGVYPLEFYLKNIVGDINNGYDISNYSKVSVSFFVDDKTKGYEFEIKLRGQTDLTLFSGTKTTGWYTVEVDLASAPDYVYGIMVDFKGIDDVAEIDGFNFYLYNVDLICDSRVMDEIEYLYKPALKAACGENHTWETKVDEEGNPVVNVIFKEATCDQNGYNYKTCTKCSHVEIEFVNAKGHTFDKVIEDQTGVGVLPGCESDGVEAYACSCEGCTATTIKPLYKTGHKFEKLENATADDGYLAPTCEEDGYDVYVCTNENCNHKGKKFILKTSKLGHAKAEGATETVISELDCDTDGVVEISECANCGESYQVVTEAIGHDYKEITESPDCVTEGKKYKKCETCGDIADEETLEPLGHTAPAKYLQTPVAETCLTPKGWKFSCTVCDKEGFIADDEDGLPLPHDWGEWITPDNPAEGVTVIEKTCGTNGHKDKTCAECGGLISELGTDAEKAECVIPMTGDHVWADDWTKSDDFEDGVKGEKWHKCTGPKCSYTKEGDKPEGAGTEGIVFAYNNVNAYVIVGYNGTDTDTEIVIPAIYKGKPVIVGNGFAGNTTITKVEIADGVLISDGAFKNCTALAKVKLPADITAIPVDAFSGCTALESIELPASCTVIKFGAFYGCTALDTITINGTLTELQMSAFAECNALTTVKYVNQNIPDDDRINDIGNDAFLNAEWTAIEAE